ncbi:MAG: ABC transporter permease [Bacteroidetes bacterium]|nr:ABC transporter permease [Bacteroidota bacterium]
MLRNYFVIAYRNLIRHKLFTSINIIGLAIGLAASLFLFQYVGFELSYDKFHANAPNICRVRLDIYKSGVFQSSSAQSYHAEAPALKESFPEILNYVRLHRADGMLSFYDKPGHVISFFEQNGLYADSSFFSVFSFPLIKGDRDMVLRNSNSMLMSASAARKYFGNSDPIGKVVSLSTDWQGGEYVVEGIFKDVPDNSHFKFDYLFSIKNLLVNDQFLNGGWYWQNFHVYLLLHPGTNARDLESRISRVIDDHLGHELKADNSQQKLLLQPLTDIHLHSNITYEIGANGDYLLVYFILIIAFLIMGIAWLNYLNLSTAKAFERAKEVGIRKVAGSSKGHLVTQFLFESLLLMMASVFIAVFIVIVFKPSFTELIGRVLPTDGLGQEWFWIVIIAVLCLGMYLTGLYPAKVLSSIQPIHALKGKHIGNMSVDRIRKGMIALQFAAAILLIIATFTIEKQITFMKEKDLGMNVHQKLIIKGPRILKSKSYLNEMKTFKNQLAQQASIRNVTSSSEVPGKPIFWGMEFKLTQSAKKDRREFKVLSVDEDFINTYDLKLLTGRNFSEQNSSDFGTAAIINETALRVLGIDDPEKALGEEIHDDSGVKRIIGVVRDFQQESLKKSNTPIVFLFIPWHNEYLTVSLNSTHIRADVNLVTEVYKNAFPDNAVEYFFLDDFFNQQYRSEEEFWNIFKIFSGLAIFIACIGLYGLSSFFISKRTKEIGIRKVLGGSINSIALLLSVDFLKLVILGFFLAIPIAILATDKWLEGFAQHISVPIWIYFLSGGVALGVALITVSFQTIKAASSNPVANLKDE